LLLLFMVPFKDQPKSCAKLAPYQEANEVDRRGEKENREGGITYNDIES